MYLYFEKFKNPLDQPEMVNNLLANTHFSRWPKRGRGPFTQAKRLINAALPIMHIRGTDARYYSESSQVPAFPETCVRVLAN